MSPFEPAASLRFDSEALLARRHIRLRPTRLCLTLAVLAFAVWVAAVNYQVNLAYAVCFWIAGFTAVSALMTLRQLLGLRIGAVYRGEVFAGDTAEVSLSISGGKRPRLFWFHAETRPDEEDDETAADQPWQRCETAGGADFRLPWPIKVFRRGTFPEPLCFTLATSAPFGLFYAECLLEWQTDALVYPAPLAHSLDHAGSGNDPEQPPDRAGLNGEDLAYLKPHQNGASLQHVAWKQYAKRGEMLDKVFDQAPPVPVSRTISYRDYPAATQRDRLASLLAHRVLEAERSGSPYLLELPTQSLPPQNGQREKALSALALM